MLKEFVLKHCPEIILPILLKINTFFKRINWKYRRGYSTFNETTSVSRVKLLKLLSFDEHSEFSSVEEIKKVISNPAIKTVSFDIFDTLVSRDLVCPTDIFKLIEEEKNIKGFAVKRILAEKKARENSDGEITTDLIYSYMPESLKQFKSIELAYELSHCHAYELGKELFNYAKHENKVIIAISDMYLSKRFIQKILLKCGYDIEDNGIYISSESNQTKRNEGELFHLVCQDRKILGQEILHIGDNYKSDCVNPSRLNIKSFHIPTPVENYILKSPILAVAKLYIAKKNLYNSMLLAKLALYVSCYKCYKSHWKILGFIIGGTLSSSYVSYINSLVEREKFRSLIFVARDGFILKKLFDSRNSTKVKTFYLQANRRLNLATSEDFSISKEKLMIKINALKVAGLNLKIEELNELTVERKKQIEILIKKNQLAYEKYLQSFDIESPAAVIDTNTASQSALNLICRFTNLVTHSVYTQIVGEQRGGTFYCFAKKLPYSKKRITGLLTEVFLTDTIPTAVGIGENGDIIFDSINRNEAIIREIHHGEICFNFMNSKEGNLNFSTLDDWASWVEELLYFSIQDELTLWNEYIFENGNTEIKVGDLIASYNGNRI